MTISPRVLIHATSVTVAKAAEAFGGRVDEAVLLLGAPGVGKSDLGLRLLAIGGELIADDQTALFIRHGKLHAECPANLRGQIEINGFGIVRASVASPSPVILAVELITERERPARMPEPRFFHAPPGLPACEGVPLIALHPHEPSAHAKIAAIAAAMAHGGVVAGAIHSSSTSFL